MKRIVFVAYSGPEPTTDGKRQRTQALLYALSQVYSIDYLIINNPVDYELARLNSNYAHVKFHLITSPETRLQKMLRKVGLLFTKHKEVVLFLNEHGLKNYKFVFSRYVAPVLSIPAGIKVVCDVDDDMSEVYRSRISQEKRTLKKFRLLQIYCFNLLLYKNLVKKITLPIYAKTEVNKATGLVLPNLPFQLLSGNRPAFIPCREARLLFVGKLTYTPNVEGIVWFIENVWPLLKARLPGIRLTIVSNLPPVGGVMDKYTTDTAIEISINEQDLANVYARAAVVIAPVFQGGGSSIKIAEAFLMGRPVVTSSFGSRGFEQAAKLGVLVQHNEEQDFAGSIIALLMSDYLEHHQQKIYTWAMESYSLTTWRQSLLNSISNLG